SLRRRSSKHETIAKICSQKVDALQPQVEILERIGLLERSGKTLRIAIPALATVTREAISPCDRLDLAKKTLEVLQTTACEQQDLAYYSFEAGMFKEAASAYQQLANTAHDQQDYKNAVFQYERLKICMQRAGLEFDPDEKIKL